MKPVRLQLSRRKGFNLQRLSRETNGLDAVNVARPSKWGNPFRGVMSDPADARLVLDAYREWVLAQIENRRSHTATLYSMHAAPAGITADDLDRLRGRNLACWCKPHMPCHTSVLLALANPDTGGGE